MNREVWKVFAGLCAIGMSAVCAGPAAAQMSEVKEKPPLYTYVASWTIPRAGWADMEKANASDQKLLDKGIADGTIVGYGNDVVAVHQSDGPTHDDWWSAMSMAGVLNQLDQFEKSGNAVSPVLSSASDHADNIYVSRYYNWHPGSWKDGYTYTAFYTLKPDAPDDAVDTLSKHLIVPVLEKLLADGTLHEYEVDTQAVHTAPPGTFVIVYLAAGADGLDKVNAALRETIRSKPLDGAAFDSMVNMAGHHDELVRSSATYK
ncbi:MAG: hypothetical protein WB683_13820 [Candidatus Sulfotelmatobacter sp.]